MRPTISIFVLALCFVTIAVAADLNIKTEMKTAVDPATTIIFALAGEVDPANGPDAAKVATSRWDEALSASQTLKTAATRLNSAENRRNGADWIAAAGDFARLAEAAGTAAAAKDGAAFSRAANDLGDTCTACHSNYKTQT